MSALSCEGSFAAGSYHFHNREMKPVPSGRAGGRTGGQGQVSTGSWSTHHIPFPPQKERPRRPRGRHSGPHSLANGWPAFSALGIAPDSFGRRQSLRSRRLRMFHQKTTQSQLNADLELAGWPSCCGPAFGDPPVCRPASPPAHALCSLAPTGPVSLVPASPESRLWEGGESARDPHMQIKK